MREGKRSSSTRLFTHTALAAAGCALLALPSAGQHTTTSPAAATGRPAVTRPSVPVARPTGTQPGGARHVHGVGVSARPNTLGPNSSAPRPTWELPKNTTPQWEIPSYNNVQPNQVQGNPRVRSHARYGVGGVGYVGVPVYADGTNYVNADGGDDTAQSEQPNQANDEAGGQPTAPRRPDYVPQQQEDWGPAGPPPDVAAAPPQRPPRTTAAEAAAAQSNGLDHPEVTLVFNDGRPSKKIHSYALTNSSIFVSENGRQTQIPVADLDLAATIAQNREAGVDFALPQTGR